MLNYCEPKENEDLTTKISAEYVASLGINVRQAKMAYELKGFTTPCGNGYDITINSVIPEDQKWSVLLHEVSHIIHNDWYRDKPVAEIEAENPY